MRRFYLAAAQSRRRTICAAVIILVLIAGGIAIYLASPERHYDANFDTRIAQPAYASDGPRVLFDEAHLNTHTADDRYKPFVELIRNDGFVVDVLREPVTASRLAEIPVFVIAGARGSNETNDAPAFTDAELAIIDQWVRSGGSLLLVTDHWPYGPAVESLGRRFGVEMGKGMVEDPRHHEPSLGESHLIFSRENGLLRDHPVTLGRNTTERVKRVLTFTGQSLLGPADAIPFLSLSEYAVDRPATKPTVEKDGGDVRVSMTYGGPVSAKGRAQGVALDVDKGRVIVLGDAAMLSAQLDRRGRPVGINFPGYDNRQLTLNIMHWLSRLL